MLRNSTFLAVSVILMFLSGCVQSNSLVDNGDEDLEQIPFELTFSADTLDRAEDTDKRFDLKDELSNGPVMLLWIGAGCTGCHDWTDMIRQKMLNGELDGSNYTIVSVHRWGEFESTDELHEVFGNAEQSDHYTPWKIVTPSQSTEAYDFNSEKSTGASIYSAYGNPGTPTLQVIAPNGVLAWQSKTYWANETVFDDGINFFQQQVNQE